MIAIHFNPNIENQINYGQALADGFKAHGIKHNLTTNIYANGDIHCIIGPWYAFKHYQNHEKVLYLDRACWNHPEYTCVNWMSKGEKLWRWKAGNKPRYHPKIKPYKKGKKLLILCDYGEDGSKYKKLISLNYDCEIRRHPAELTAKQGLIKTLAGFSMACGGKSTALVTAAIEGLAVFSSDRLSPAHPVSSLGFNQPSRRAWLSDLSYHNWNTAEIESGELWHHLRQ